jgi:transcriptional regulator with XRE-family HTH domain
MARITLAELIDLLRVRVAAAGGQQQFADSIGVSQGYVNDILAGKREPGPKILLALGYKKVSLYEMMRIIRMERRTDKIEFKRDDGFWYPLHSEWTFDRKAQEFVYRQGTNKETRYGLSRNQPDPAYIYGELPISPHGEIVIGRSTKRAK